MQARLEQNYAAEWPDPAKVGKAPFVMVRAVRSETRHALRLRRFCARIAKPDIQAATDRSPHTALRAKVGYAQEAPFAESPA